MPRTDREAVEQLFERRLIGKTGRGQAHRVFGAGRQGADGAGRFAGEVIEDHRFADVRPPHHRHYQERIGIELGHQLMLKQREPFLAVRRRNANRGRRGFQRDERTIQPFDVVGPGGEFDAHERESIAWPRPERGGCGAEAPRDASTHGSKRGGNISYRIARTI